jgi:uncharacterized protein (TIGR02145 family)
MKKNISVIILLIVFLQTQAQDYLITFGGSGAAISVGTVKVDNLTSGISVILNGDDILHLIPFVGIKTQVTNDRNLRIYPNPMSDQCMLSFVAPDQGTATISIFDVSGKTIVQTDKQTIAGSNTFCISGIRQGLYFVTIMGRNYNYSSKLLSQSYIGSNPRIEFVSSDAVPKQNPFKNGETTVEMEYTIGDILLSGIYRTIVTDVPTSSKKVTFSFVECTDTDNNNYSTVRIGSQTWMAENLNVGAQINGNQQQTNNGIAEKYAYNDNSANCDIYGGLYQWDEIMQYNTNNGAKGLCPNGWHIPTDDEFNTLSDYLGGEDVAGGKLKETTLTHWLAPNTGATNSSGFTALPGGNLSNTAIFQNLNDSAYFWSSSVFSSSGAWARYLGSDNSELGRNSLAINKGFSVRCIHDYTPEINILTGDVSKTWKLLRDVSTGDYPLQVGPIDHSTIWWAMGYYNNELANRPCMLNDEWTFVYDGSLDFDAKGDFWAEGGIFDPANYCESTENMIGITGEDCSPWGSGNHMFRLESGSSSKLTSLGKGAYIGFYKTATDMEVQNLTPMVQDSVTYNVIKLKEGVVDTLIVEIEYKFQITSSAPEGYWRYVLVHYDNPADEPPIPGNLPVADFTFQINGLSITCNNTSTGADSYFWDFGDGQTSTEINPIHTYTNGSIYNVQLVATNQTGNDTLTEMAFISNSVLTDALLQGAPWRVRAEEQSVFVGSGLGKSDWWSLPKSFLTGGGYGSDDWSCMPDDEFTFTSGGIFTYNTSGSARNDGYFGGSNGCITDAQIAASGNGTAFGSATHSYSFTPATATERPIITLINGTGHAAFLGFYKGYYGGENVDPYQLPNGGYSNNKYEVMGYASDGTKEYLFVSVDITYYHEGTAAWSVILER